DDENVFGTLDGTPEDTISAGTGAGELEGWLKDSGMYTGTDNDSNWFFEKGLSHAKKLIPHEGLYTQNIIMLINAHVLNEGLQATGNPKSDEFILRAFPNHYCV